MNMVPEILYITFNRLEYTMKTLPLVFKNTKKPFKLVIWDNGSTDGTQEYLKTFSNHPKVKCINFCKNNKGISPVTNWFWEQAECDIVGKIDNDILLCDNWLEKLLPYMTMKLKNSYKIGAIGLNFWHDYERDLIARHSDLYSQFIYSEDNLSFVHSPHLGGACYLINRELVMSIGPLMNPTGALKGGWTKHQWDLNKEKRTAHGYILPLNKENTVIHMDDFRYPGTISEKAIEIRGDKEKAKATKQWEFKHAISVLCRKGIRTPWIKIEGEDKVVLTNE